jgi:hypothetical protein
LRLLNARLNAWMHACEASIGWYRSAGQREQLRPLRKTASIVVQSGQRRNLPDSGCSRLAAALAGSLRFCCARMPRSFQATIARLSGCRRKLEEQRATPESQSVSGRYLSAGLAHRALRQGLLVRGVAAHARRAAGFHESGTFSEAPLKDRSRRLQQGQMALALVRKVPMSTTDHADAT